VKRAGVDSQVAVLCCFCQGDRRAGCSELNSLCANHNHRITMCIQGLEGIEQCRT